MRSTKLSPGNPFGCWFDRNGFGAGGSPRCLRFSGIDLALEAEPQGGAKKIPMTFSLDSHCISKLTPASVVRSVTATGAIACLCRKWSVPKALIIPNLFNSAVTLEVPEKTSIIMQSLRPAPTAARASMRFGRHLAFPS